MPVPFLTMACRGSDRARGFRHPIACDVEKKESGFGRRTDSSGVDFLIYDDIVHDSYLEAD
jgi:hypothetical protein